ncbi:hypothetical protein BV898_16048 [Hypsibius exemplaris]|uniref:Uncharacterized protein n=1 Tax=Hypsibius exemplaris TaxID=2072580 RepID=A0A9X6NF23_HYPEX|nr:hypothetical protein BV898_16048 [Hypsibius exemplaris]
MGRIRKDPPVGQESTETVSAGEEIRSACAPRDEDSRPFGKVAWDYARDHPSVGLFGSNVSSIVSEVVKKNFKFTHQPRDFFIAFLLLAHSAFFLCTIREINATYRHWNPTEVKKWRVIISYAVCALVIAMSFTSAPCT